MAIPIALVLKIVGGILLGGAAAAAAAKQDEEARETVTAKRRVLLVGPTDSGKTVLFDLLTRGVPDTPELGDTRDTFEFHEVDATSDDLSLSVVDSPSTSFRANEMHLQINNTDVVVFVADAALLLGDDYADSAERLAMRYRGFAESEPGWCLLLTHADRLDPRLEPETYQTQAPSCTRLRKILDDASDVELYNLLQPESAQSAVARVLRTFGS